MKNIAIAVSDLHMGFNPRMDNFAGDAKFAQFCERVAKFARERNAQLTFILGGDIFEMWEMAPEEETQPDTPVEVISANLLFPAVGAAAEAAATDRGRWQIDQAMAAHPVFAQGMAHLLTADTRLVYLVGNHDHAMANPAIQEHLRQRLEEATGSTLDTDRLRFGQWLALPTLKLYAEHGQQFSDADSSYPDVTEWRVEAPGYYFLRYVYSRIEGLPAGHLPMGELILTVVNLAFHRLALNDQLKRYLFEYFAAHEALGFPLAQGPAVPFVGHVITAVYENWKAHGRPQDAGSAELARQCREVAGRAEIERTDGMADNAESFANSNLKKVKTGLPGRLLNYTSTHSRDRYAMGFRDRFAREISPFPRLTALDGMTCLAGHTHREHHSRLLDSFMTTVRYINVGSWSAGPKRTSYCAVTDDSNEFRNRLLYHYR